MKIAIDFDGVILKRKGIPTSKEPWLSNDPVEGALDSVTLLMGLGHEVYIFTSNSDQERIKTWLSMNHFPELKITNIKEPASIYIDDRAIRFTNWQDIRKYFS